MKACPLVINTEKQLIKDIIVNENPDFALKTIDYIIKNLISRKINLDVLIFNEKINKPIDSYYKLTPHVAAAKKLIEKGIRVRQGSNIPYFITSGEGPISSRAEPYLYQYNQGELKSPDIDYYIEKQLLPMRDNLFKATGNLKSENDWYYHYLRTFHWRLLRQTLLDYADHKCQVCSETEDLEVHHNTYEHLWFEETYDLVVLCSKHHELIHNQGVATWPAKRSLPLSV